MDEMLLEKSASYARHLSALFGADVYVIRTRDGSIQHQENCDGICRSCTFQACQRSRVLLYGCSEAHRWNGRFIYYCPLGLTFLAAPLTDDRGMLSGGIVMGPLLLGDKADALASLPEASMAETVSHMDPWPAQRVTHLSAMLSACAAHASILAQTGIDTYSGERESVLTMPRELSVGSELIQYEKQLQQAVGGRDRAEASRLINEILSHVYSVSLYNLPLIKTRVVEMLVLLSRAAIDAGADAQEMFLYNHTYISQIENAATLDEMNLKLGAIIHRFIHYAFDFERVRYSHTVYQVIQYLKTHYQQKLTLDDIANQVFLSRAYLSTLFKEKTGEGIFAYLSRIRVENSKVLLMDHTMTLADVAAACGFVDQSYYNKVFKKLTGLSPRQFRENARQENK